MNPTSSNDIVQEIIGRGGRSVSLCGVLSIPIVLLALAASLPTAPLRAQEHASAPRADGHETPLAVYGAAETKSGCAPLAVISHGAGGSENGFTAVVMGHRESGGRALRRDILGDGILGGVTKLVSDPEAESDRLLDVGAALKWSESRCSAPFRVLLGHSMGAETVMLEAGAQNIIDVKSPPAGKDRFDAYVALSPEGPGVVFPDHAWNGIHKPILILTGTRDQSLKAGPKARLIPWHDLPGDGARKCQWMGVIDGATHMNFAGAGIGAQGADRKVTPTIMDFLHGVRAGVCTLPSPMEGMTLQAK
jgi:dienelactone hydrolase